MRRMMLPAALAVAVLSGCTYSKKEKRAAEVSGAIDATVTKVDKKALGIGAIGGGHVGILVPEIEKSSVCLLRITKPKPLDLIVPPPCDENYALAIDPEGQRLAYAPPGDVWSILYFGAGNRSFGGLTHPPIGPLDWSKVPRLADTYVAQLAAMIARDDKTDVLFDEIVEAKGDGELTRVLLATITSPAENDFNLFAGKHPAWQRGLDRVKDRTVIDAALAARLGDLSLSSAESANATMRAVLYADLDKPALVATWSKALATAGFQESWSGAHYVIAVLLARLGKLEPAAGARIACSLLEKSGPAKEAPLSMKRTDVFVALAVLGHSKTKCAAVANVDAAWERFEPESCSFPAWREPGTMVDEFIEGDLESARRMGVPIEESIIAAVLASGPRPSRKLQLARQLYETKTDAPDCQQAAIGVRCSPPKTQLRKLMCATGASFTEDNVTVHFDDPGRRYWFTSAATPAPSVSASANE